MLIRGTSADQLEEFSVQAKKGGGFEKDLKAPLVMEESTDTYTRCMKNSFPSETTTGLRMRKKSGNFMRMGRRSACTRLLFFRICREMNCIKYRRDCRSLQKVVQYPGCLWDRD